jgi:hypothetical protein
VVLERIAVQYSFKECSGLDGVGCMLYRRLVLQLIIVCSSLVLGCRSGQMGPVATKCNQHVDWGLMTQLAMLELSMAVEVADTATSHIELSHTVNYDILGDTIFICIEYSC